MINKDAVYAACLAGTLLFVATTRAEDTVLLLRPVNGLKATHVKDGTTLIRGTVRNALAHTGFSLRLRCDDSVSDGTCLLPGERNTEHRLQVALVADSAERMPDGSVFIDTAEPYASFRIVAAGDQEVPADSWGVVVTTSSG